MSKWNPEGLTLFQMKQECSTYDRAMFDANKVTVEEACCEETLLEFGYPAYLAYKSFNNA